MLNTKRNEIYNANDVINSNDLRKRIANVDSRFRSSGIDHTTDFSYKFDTPYKNVIRVRVASVEIPNTYYTFSASNFKNTSFVTTINDIYGNYRDVKIEIPDGNYTASSLIAELQNQFNKTVLVPYGVYIQITQDTQLLKTIIVNKGLVQIPTSGPQPWPPTDYSWNHIKSTYTTFAPNSFKINFLVPEFIKRIYNNGLGYNLGFRMQTYDVTFLPELQVYGVFSEACIDVNGDSYCFLQVDDFSAVNQQTDTNTFECLAKVIIRESKGTIIYDDGRNLLSNDVIFPSPVNISNMRVRLLDPYGKVINLNDMNFSFSLEFTEVMNTKLYEFYRNYIWLGQLPSLQQDVRGSGVPLLGGRGP